MNDLFAPQAGFEILPMPDADVRYWRHFYDAVHGATLMQRLLDETPWRQEAVTVWGKTHLQPRLSAWVADPGIAYAYAGLQLQALPWTASLLAIRHDIEAACGRRFNSVLLNLYRDGRDSMGWHSDDEAELGTNPAIASLSLGETRIFAFRHKTLALEAPRKITLEHGSLLLMAGATQHHWRHAIARQAGARQARINLTFRQILQGAGKEALQ